MVVNRVGVLALGTIANGVVGALTGLLGSLIWQHESRILVAIMLIGSLSGGSGGLLHALVIVVNGNNKKVGGKADDDDNGDSENGNFVGVCARVFSEAPCWSVIGASIGFWTTRNLTSDNNISFPVVIFTALAGTLSFAIYAMVMYRLTGSDSHFLILQNQVLVLAQRLNIWIHQSTPSSKPYQSLMPEFESSPTKPKQIFIDIKEDS